MISPTVAPLLRFLGLSDVADTAWGEKASFPLGVLYPYSPDLQRVCDRFDAVMLECPEDAPLFIGETRRDAASLSPKGLQAVNSYLQSIAMLSSRIAFAPGTAGRSVAAAHQLVADAIAQTTPGQESEIGDEAR